MATKPTDTVSTETLSLLLVGNKMREQIKELQERRAAAMMFEITELQKERDVLLARVKQSESYNTELMKENWVLKEASNKEADLKLELTALHQQYMEEKLLVNDLKKKVHVFEKKNNDLITKLQSSGSSHFSPSLRYTQQWKLSASNDEKSQSMNDLTNTKTPSSSPLPSPFTSPGLIPRRYKLATISNCHQETQTEVVSDPQEPLPIENLPRPVLEALSAAKDDLMYLQDQNKNLNNKLKKFSLEKEENEAMKTYFTERYEVLKTESSVLRESLSQFSQWVQHKISSVEEEMDICKVIYSLHGSLAKDTQAIEDIRQKLLTSESSVNKLTTMNDYLSKALSDTQTQLQNSQAEAKLLREQLRKALKHHSSTGHHRSTSHTLAVSSPLVKNKIKRSPKPNHRELYQLRNSPSNEFI